jgi:hypothetical protein
VLLLQFDIDSPIRLIDCVLDRIDSKNHAEEIDIPAQVVGSVEAAGWMA